jgi:hypothetical protein
MFRVICNGPRDRHVGFLDFIAFIFSRQIKKGVKPQGEISQFQYKKCWLLNKKAICPTVATMLGVQ